MKVLFTPEIRAWFDELEITLHEKGYFGFRESSHKYVNNLFVDIRTTLPVRQCRRAPGYFDRYGSGMYCVTFRMSRETVWYVFFVRYRVEDEIVYLVRHLENNHTAGKYF